MVKKKTRRAIVNKKSKKLDVIGYDKLDIMWFWQCLKLAVDLEGQSFKFSKAEWQTGNKNKQVRVKKTKSFKIKINESALKGININELRRMSKIINMNKKEIFKNFNTWFEKYKHLFGDWAVRYVEHRSDLIESNEYMTIQIPVSLDRRTIDNQIDEIRKGFKLKPPGGKKRDITFIRGVQKDVMQKQWEVFKMKTTTDTSNQDIAQEVGYTKKKNSLNVYANKQLVGLRSVQKANESAKCIILNVGKGVFPKSTIE